MTQNDTLEAFNLDHLIKIYYTPPYNLIVPADKVKEIKLPKPSGKIFWNDLI